jgi:hypothetical protein
VKETSADIARVALIRRIIPDPSRNNVRWYHVTGGVPAAAKHIPDQEALS